MSQAIQPLKLDQLPRFPVLQTVVVESLEQALYRVVIEHENRRYFLTENNGKNLIRRNKLDILALFHDNEVGQFYLQHISPYDEMIGLSETPADNCLRVPLGDVFRELKTAQPGASGKPH